MGIVWRELQTPMRIIILALFACVVSHATVINAASCSVANVQTAIDSATDGDTVVLPSCSATWSGAGPIVSITNKGITLQGQTTCNGSPGVRVTSCTDNTNITLSPSGGFPVSGLLITASATHFTQVTGITFISGATSSSGLINVTGVEADVAVRIDYNHFKNALSNLVMLEVAGVYGLIDHALWDQTDSSNASDPFVHIDGAANPGNNDGSAAWNRDLTLGTNKAIYFEDSTFNMANGAESVFDAYTGARLVFRYSQFTNTGTNGGAAPFGVHGTDSGTLRSTFSYELYNCTVTNNGSYTMPTAQLRGGTGAIHDNTWNGSGGAWGNIQPQLFRLACLEPNNVSSWGTLTGAPWFLTSTDPSTDAGRTNSTFAADFQTSHSYTAGATVLPLTNNTGGSTGHYNFQVASNCTSGSYPGSWNQTYAGTTTDSGGCVWTNIGGGSGGSKVQWCAVNRDTKCTADNTCSLITGGDTCSAAFDASSANGYPGRDEVGRTHNQVLSPLYAWNNGSISITPDSCTTTFLSSGVDYISGTARPGYTPYTYPHPLQGASSTGGSALNGQGKLLGSSKIIP